MLDLLVQVAGLALLLGGVGLGYRRWVLPRESSLDLAQRGVLLLLIVTLVGGFVGSPVWWLDDPRSFSWDLPPLAGRMLAAAGWSFVALGLAVLHYPTAARLRLALVMLAVYLAPLALAIVLWHRDRFDSRAPITYAFFAIVAVLLAPTFWFLARPPQPITDYPDHIRPPSPALARWLDVVTLITGAWGLALFLTDRGFSPLIWAWPGDLLTSRLIAVMLLTIAAGAIMSRARADLARVTLLATIVYGLGLGAASLWGIVLGQPLRPAYAIVFICIAAVSWRILATMPTGSEPPQPGASEHLAATRHDPPSL